MFIASTAGWHRSGSLRPAPCPSPLPSTEHAHRPRPRSRPVQPLRWRCAWYEQSVRLTVPVPPQRAFALYSNLELMPRWSPWLRSVSVDAHDPMVSEWCLAARGFQFRWRARNTCVQPPERIAWESLSGLRNRGQVTFRPLPSAIEDAEVNRSDDTATEMELLVAFALPDWASRLLRNVDWVGAFVRGTLHADLERFREYVVQLADRERLTEGSSTA